MRKLIVPVMGLLLLVACGGQTPAASVATPPPVPSATPAPSTATSLPPTVVAATEALPSATLPPATPTVAAAATATEIIVESSGQTPPEEAILIQVPGPGSRVTSPLRVEGMADSTFEQTLVARLVSPDGVELALVPTTIQAELGQRGFFTVDIPFTIAGEENAFLQVFATSPRDGGLTHLSSVVVRLAESGPEEIQPAPARREDIEIFSPRPGATVSGGVVRVEGFARASFEQTLIVELLDVNGSTLARQPIIVESSEMGQPGPFRADLSYAPAAAGPARVVVRDPSAAFEGTVHLSSAEIRLEP